LVFTLLYNTYESHQRSHRRQLYVEEKLGRRREAAEPGVTMLDTMHTHNFDAVRYAWTADYDDAATFLNTFRTGDSENTSQYSNPAYDEALRNAAKASDVASRGKYYQQAEDLLAQDVPAIPVYHYVRTHLVKPWVGGFTPDKLGYYYTKDMYIKKHPSASGDGR
jgi:oligopeptide transport system substrate-binding protein